jgi:hypothetical protein
VQEILIQVASRAIWRLVTFSDIMLKEAYPTKDPESAAVRYAEAALVNI